MFAPGRPGCPLRTRSVHRWVSPLLLTLLAIAGCGSRAEAGDAGKDGSPDAPGAPQALSGPPVAWRIAYGSDSSQYGELRVPPGPGPHPVAVLIHGGCFKAAYATQQAMAPLGDSLKAAGIATWNIEYRRLGQPGGGWPGTYGDVANAVDYLRVLASRYPLDLGRLAIVGHSAGGHLAMWAAARVRVPAGSAIHSVDPLPVSGVLDLAGPVDLTANIAGYEGLCGDTVVTGLLGGAPAAVPERYAQASPMFLLPLGVPQVILIGDDEEFVPRRLMEDYVRAAEQAGDQVRLIVVPRVSHHDLASPLAPAWPRVESVLESLLDGRLPPGNFAAVHQ